MLNPDPDPATGPLTLCMAGPTFYFRYLVFHVSIRPHYFRSGHQPVLSILHSTRLHEIPSVTVHTYSFWKTMFFSSPQNTFFLQNRRWCWNISWILSTFFCHRATWNLDTDFQESSVCFCPSSYITNKYWIFCTLLGSDACILQVKFGGI